MNRKSALWVVLELIFLIVFNVVFFMTVGIRSEASVWISYGFIHVTYIMLMLTPVLTKKTSNSVILGLPLLAVSATWFLVELVVGLIFILAHPRSYKACLLIQIVIAGIYAAALVANLLANEYTADNIECHEKELRYVKDASARLKGIMDSTKDRAMRRKVERLFDLLHSSPVRSDNAVRNYEITVMELIDVLDDCIGRDDYEAAESVIREIERNASERNRQIKYR